MTNSKANHVIILGAGASVHAKVPTMRDFLRKAEDVLAYHGDKEEFAEDFGRVFHAIALLRPSYATSKIDLNNIEDLFGIMEMGIIVSRLGMETNRDKIIEFRDSLRRVIVRTIEYSMRFKGTTTTPIRASEEYGMLAELLINIKESSSPFKNATIITFNYDCGMDIAFQYRDKGAMEIDYGLTESRSGFRLLKLHGSINWATEKGNDEVIHVLPLNTKNKTRVELTYQAPNGIGISYLIGLYHGLFNDYGLEPRQLNYDPIIVPPTWSKGEHQSRLSSVWQLAAQDLSSAQNIFVIGYSLPETDSFFRHLMSLGTSSDLSRRRFWVFDPDKSGIIKERYKRIIGDGVQDARYFSATFDANTIEAIRLAMENIDHNKNIGGEKL